MNGSQATQPGNRETAVKTLQRLGTRLLFALIAGCALYLVAFALSYKLLFMRLLVEQAADARMQLFADYRAPAPGTTSIVFLDLDQKSYAQLGRPIVTPRKLLAAMLERVAEGKPKLIILDFDPTWPGDKEGTQKLAHTLARLGRGSTPILLYRSPMAPVEKGGAIYFRPSPELDPVVKGSNSLMWVSSGAVASEDGVVRRVPLWMRGCLGEKLVHYAGSAMAGWMILENEKQPAPTVIEQLTRALEEKERSCEDGKATAQQGTDLVSLTVGGHSYPVGQDWPTGTIIYSMSAKLAKGLQRNPKALIELSARPFVEGSPNISTEIFRDRGVIIGSSAPDLRDIHLTPLGKMPGAMVIANQLHSLQEHGMNEDRSFCFGLLMTVVLCVGTFLAWLGFRRIAPVAPYIAEQIYSILIGGVIWVILTAVVDTSAALLIPLLQYLVMLVLFSLEHERGG